MLRARTRALIRGIGARICVDGSTRPEKFDVGLFLPYCILCHVGIYRRARPEVWEHLDGPISLAREGDSMKPDPNTKRAHTPGPWQAGKRNVAEVDGFRFYRIPISGQGQAIASVWDGSAERVFPGFTNGEANAALIIAAPDLLAALKECESHLTDFANDVVSDSDHDPSVAAELELLRRQVAAVIAKAEGRT